jgi:hypothetical protein
MGGGRNGERAAVEQQRRETYIGSISAATAMAAAVVRRLGSRAAGRGDRGQKLRSGGAGSLLCLASVVVGAAPGVCRSNSCRWRWHEPGLGPVSWYRRQVGPTRQLRNSLLYFKLTEMALGRWPSLTCGPCLVPRLTRFRGSIWNSGIFPHAAAKAVKIPVSKKKAVKIPVYIRHQVF